MEENIIGLIAEAEKDAAAKKAEAEETALTIVAAAEKQAQEILKNSEAECAAYRENALKCAAEQAQSDYEKALNDSRQQAKEYADGLLARSDNFVLDIVGRLTK